MSAAARNWRTPPPGVIGLPAPVARNPSTCLYTAPIEPCHQPRSDRLLITVATGAAGRELSDISAPAMRAYAAQVGADFVVLNNQTQTWPLAEKFRLEHYAQLYERTLFCDADVYIRPGAPDIFAHVPRGAVAMHDDSAAQSGDWPACEQRLLGESQGVTIPAGCWNSGVVLCDRQDATIWRAPAKPFPVLHCMEQHWVQRNALATGRLFSLAPEWNWQYWVDPQFTRIAHAHFIHLSGMAEAARFRLPLLRALALER